MCGSAPPPFGGHRRAGEAPEGCETIASSAMVLAAFAETDVAHSRQRAEPEAILRCMRKSSPIPYDYFDEWAGIIELLPWMKFSHERERGQIPGSALRAAPE